jgi:hypothetical protein
MHCQVKSFNIFVQKGSEGDMTYMVDSSNQGGYFMSQTEEDAAKFRMIIRYKEAKERLDVLRSEAREIGEKFKLLSQCLQRVPQNVVIDGQSITGEYLGTSQNFTSSDFDVEKIKRLGAEIRSLTKEIQDLEPKVKVYGIS